MRTIIILYPILGLLLSKQFKENSQSSCNELSKLYSLNGSPCMVKMYNYYTWLGYKVRTVVMGLLKSKDQNYPLHTTLLLQCRVLCVVHACFATWTTNMHSDFFFFFFFLQEFCFCCIHVNPGIPQSYYISVYIPGTTQNVLQRKHIIHNITSQLLGNLFHNRDF